MIANEEAPDRNANGDAIMNRYFAGVISAALAAATISTPHVADAQYYHSYGPDPCHAERRQAANTGAVAGGATGAILGGAVIGHSLGGALIGGAVGAVAGHEIAKSTVSCVSYPRRISYHRANCRWVEEYHAGRRHDFEVCRGGDGVWRPSGRS